MTSLVIVTVLWAFSFSLIGVYLAGAVDSYFAVFTRTALAVALFAPLIDWRRTGATLAGQLIAVGAVQLGVMYIFFYQSFLYLSVPEILLFTIFTPLYVTLLDDLLRGRFSPIHLVSAALAVAGAAVIRYKAVSDDFLFGFLMVQGANLCFAAGQVGYRWVMERTDRDLPQMSVFGFFFIGALIVATVAFVVFGDVGRMPTTLTQWSVLIWLGVGASGIGYFLWNRGALQVDAGTLAVMNNALIPAGLVVNLTLWNQDAPLDRLTLGGGLIVVALMVNGWWLRQRLRRAEAA